MRFVRRSFFWALLFALVVAGATVRRAAKLGSPDFRVFFVAARHVLTEPANLYKVSPDRYLYPPPAAILLTPFAFSENYPLHQWMWHGLLALLVLALAAAGWAELAALAILSRYLAITFGYGQINLVVMSLLAGAGAWLRLHPGRAGALWGLASTLKIYPLVFAPAFYRRWKGLAAGAGVALLVLLLPFLVFGPALGAQLYGEFFGSLESKGLPLHSHNQSLSALLHRLFTDQKFHLHAVHDTQWTLLSLPAVWVKVLAWAIGLMLLVPTWWRAFKRGEAESFLSAAAFSILFLSHIVWKDYMLFLFFPLAEVFRHSPRRRCFLLGAVVVALVTLSGPDIAGAPLSTRLDAACIHLWAAIIVWVAWWKR